MLSATGEETIKDKKKMIWVLRPVTIISLILRWVNRKVGQKREIPEKKNTWPLARIHSGEMSDLER